MFSAQPAGDLALNIVLAIRCPQTHARMFYSLQHGV